MTYKKVQDLAVGLKLSVGLTLCVSDKHMSRTLLYRYYVTFYHKQDTSHERLGRTDGSFSVRLEMIYVNVLNPKKEQIKNEKVCETNVDLREI